jgi:nicotinamide-nucleotide amidase
MTPFRTAEIIAVGSELLTPFRTDSNSLFLTAGLNDLGIDVTQKTVVGDRVDDLVTAIADAAFRADVVLITGGLGPTADDLTREAAATAFGLPLEEDPALVDALRARFRRRSNAPMPENNRQQARVIQGAVVLPNPNGSAPGQWLERGEHVVVLMPGPPREMQPMFESEVRPRLAARSDGARLSRRVIKIAGQPESLVDEIAAPIYTPWMSAPLPVFTTILSKPGQVELHLSATGVDQAAVNVALDAGVSRLVDAIGDSVFTTTGEALENVVGARLKACGATIALAESCTGGLVAARLTEVPGSSEYVRGGVVAYSNDVKVGQLGVDAALLAAHGAVSEPVAQAMAEGVRQRLGADVGVAVTGIAGPGGGSADKPVGTVWFAVSGAGAHAETLKRVVPGSRALIRAWSVIVALDLVRRALR